MPLYEYVCNQCKQEVELLMRSSSDKAVCPNCGSDDMNKKFSTFAAHDGGQSVCDSGACPASQAVGGGCPGGRCPMG